MANKSKKYTINIVYKTQIKTTHEEMEWKNRMKLMLTVVKKQHKNFSTAEGKAGGIWVIVQQWNKNSVTSTDARYIIVNGYGS